MPNLDENETFQFYFFILRDSKSKYEVNFAVVKFTHFELFVPRINLYYKFTGRHLKFIMLF